MAQGHQAPIFGGDDSNFSQFYATSTFGSNQTNPPPPAAAYPTSSGFGSNANNYSNFFDEPQREFPGFSQPQPQQPQQPFPPPQTQSEFQQVLQEKAHEQKHRHPLSIIFHFFFRTAAVVSVILCWLFNVEFTVTFIVVVLLLSADFWTVKNVTGRLLVGLRWWNEIKDDGTSVWRFESLEGTRVVHRSEAMLFWAGLVLAPVVWLVFAILSLIRFSPNYLIITCVGVVLSSTNLFGYFKCSRSSQERAKSAATQFVIEKAANYATTPNAFGSFGEINRS